MIKLTVSNNNCSAQSEGTRLECSTEAIVAFISLVEIVAEATHTSFEHAALFMYQQGVLTKHKVDEGKIKREEVNGKEI